MKTKQNLHDYVADKIREKILVGQYVPGTKLPNEFELAKEYDVCRYTVREAIKKLVATGLVVVVRGRGTYINEVAPSTYFKPIIEKLVLVGQDVSEIFDARLAIEPKTASLAAVNALAHEIEEMRNTISSMQYALKNDDFVEFNRLDITLHNQIAIASKNKILNIIVDILYDVIRYAIEKASISKEKHQKSFEEHIKIVKAIEERNADEAAERMYNHLLTCKVLLQN